ncbi:hypothetical protein CIRG_00171 [Coccidioides immitis RMSCC 2394]|uniref:Uncharacterized protein n=1 Tax=Coccidioides immitis RMSCC 2394 TaxID=404692 RepID=A0A0J6XZ54_COCIT|nr:hypothetical protein CIRG_00171 [Coccidioides immitis RMSCC 2394]
MVLNQWVVVSVLSVLHGHALAFPRPEYIPPSPGGGSCMYAGLPHSHYNLPFLADHLDSSDGDHGDCSSLCTTTSSWTGIATSVSDFGAFKSSLDAKYGTEPSSGDRIPVHTTAFSFPGAGYITAYGYYNSKALSSAGYKIISGVTTITGPCEPTATLPPSPTGSACEPHGHPPRDNTPGDDECEPHGDHWHCPPGVPEPTTSTTASQPTNGPPADECEPHGDHWHCPPGVPEPTTPPPASQPTNSAPAGECEPHGDHWHCPPGVPEPTTPPRSSPSQTNGPPADECEPHGDHWHCPPGVPEPTTPPPASQPTNSAPAGECEPHGDHWALSPPASPNPPLHPRQPLHPPLILYSMAPARRTSSIISFNGRPGRFGHRMGSTIVLVWTDVK